MNNSNNGTAISISWEPPANPNGTLLGYSVNITNLRDGSTENQTLNMTTVSEYDLGIILSIGIYVHYW